jgi:hypothetical protein
VSPFRSTITRWATDARARAVVVPFVASRAVVLAALVLTRHVVTALHASPPPVQVGDGLLAWDASWYRDIALHGYGGVAKEGLRFFPFLPMLARVGSWLPGVSVRLALLLVVNACALAVGALVYDLARNEGRSDAVARRAVWIVYLAPPAFVLVMGYAEATLMTATLVALLAMRRRRWWIAAIAGVVAGLTRPVGLLLVVPALVEAYRAPRRQAGGASTRREYAARVAAVFGSVVGTGAYLLWAEHRTGDLLYPLRVQQVSARRGGWIDPARAVWRAARDASSGDHLSAGIHVVTVAVLIALLVVLWRRWPASFTAYAVAAVGVALSARHLDSLERYSLSTVPLVLAAAELVGGGMRERVVLVAMGATLVAFSVLAFTGVLVP